VHSRQQQYFHIYSESYNIVGQI